MGKMTDPSFTMTAQGPIPHYRMGKVSCPVKILTQADGTPVQTKDGLPTPLTRESKFVYSFPGGGEFLAGVQT